MYYKKKTHFKVIIIVIICFLIIIPTIIFNMTRIKLMIKGYGFNEQNVILSLDDQMIDEYLSLDRFIDFDRWDKLENQKHYYDYDYYSKLKEDLKDNEIIKYIDEFYALYDSKLKKSGYDISICRKLMKKLSIDDFYEIADEKYKDIKDYLNTYGCIIKDIPEYMKSKKDVKEAILSISYPFIDSRNQVNRTYMINEPNHLLVLIKKGFCVDSQYVPNDLVKVNIPIAPDNSHDMLRKEAADALKEMYDDALKEGYHLVLNSGYRSYSEQKKIYDEYFRIYDEITAAGLVSVPGSSEHQLGLGVDLTSQSVIDKEKMVFGDTKEYQWAIQNAHHYGFILRYPKNRSNITGTANEPWHFRYVGKEVANEIYEKNWTLEEYVLNHGLSYDLSLK